MRKENNEGITVGYASIIVVFVILVFVIFSILSYRQANSSLSRVERSIEITKAHHEADSAAMMIKMEVDNILKEAATLEEAKKTIIRSIPSINSYDNRLEYTIIISEKARLEVQLTMSQMGVKSKITSWKISTTNDGNYTQQGFDF